MLVFFLLLPLLLLFSYDYILGQPVEVCKVLFFFEKKKKTPKPKRAGGPHGQDEEIPTDRTGLTGEKDFTCILGANLARNLLIFTHLPFFWLLCCLQYFLCTEGRETGMMEQTALAFLFFLFLLLCVDLLWELRKQVCTRSGQGERITKQSMANWWDFWVQGFAFRNRHTVS